MREQVATTNNMINGKKDLKYLSSIGNGTNIPPPLHHWTPQHTFITYMDL